LAPTQDGGKSTGNITLGLITLAGAAAVILAGRRVFRRRPD
jgi:hypothetical protein